MSYPPPDEPQEPRQPQQPEQPYGQQPTGPGTPASPYGQQPGPYGQQPGYPPYHGYGQPPGTNVMAILSLVFAFVFAPIGIVFGHLARKQIKQSGEQGSQLATWGLILSYIFTALWVIACCAWIGVLIWAGTDGSGSSF